MSAGNILVVTQWGYEEGLIQSYTLPYVKMIHKASPGSKIYLITQEKGGLEKNKPRLEEIKKDLRAYNIHLVAGKYRSLSALKYISSFFNGIRHVWLILTRNIRYIHTFCTPAGGYGYLLSKLTGRKLVIDSYEPHSEYMREGKVWDEKSFTYRALRYLEKKQATRASYLIATTRSMIDYSNRRFDIHIKSPFVKPACVDLDKFSYLPSEREHIRSQLHIGDKIVCVYAGKFGGYYLKDEVFEFLQVAFKHWKGRFFFLLLSDLDPVEFKQLAEQYSLDMDSMYLIKAPFNEVSAYLSAADFALSAYRPAASKKYCAPIKNGEYWAVGLPVVITKDISVDSDIIQENQIGYVLQDLSEKEYSNAVSEMDGLLLQDRDELRRKIRGIAEQCRSFKIAEDIYERIYSPQVNQ